MFENKIIFESEDNFYFDNSLKPEPAVNNIPEWWKGIPKFANKESKEISDKYAVTVKGCAPTLDSLMSGYILKLWKDIEVIKTSDGKQEVVWQDSDSDEFHSTILEHWHPDQVSRFEVPYGFSPTVLKFRHGWIIKTPPGWSTLFVHPFAYQNLPIRSIPGIVDTDILKTDINCPFFIRNDFEGIIPKGTPISQLIPIKRESWKASYKKGDPEELIDERNKIYLHNYGFYLSRREKKSYK